MYCDNCGQELREGAKFCPKCGARFSDRNEYTAHMDREVQETDSDSSQNQTENSDSKGNDNKKPKWILYMIVAICVLAAIFAAVMFFLTMNSGMTPQKAYKKYYKILENDKSKVVEFEKEKGANGVAITDINNTGIPDVLYITNNSEDGTDKLYLHSLMDNEKDIEIDMDEELSGSIGESNTIFRIKEDSAIYLRNEYGLSRITYSIDDSGTRVIQTKMLAKRTLDEESDEYVYMILTDSGVLESVSEKEYNKYIDDICKQDVTIIITTLSNEELNKIFPSIDDNISMNCDDALKKLKNNDIDSTGETKAVSSEQSTIEETKELETKAPVTDPPTEEPTEPPVAEDYIKLYDEGSYYSEWDKEECHYRMPLLTIESDDAIAFNNMMTEIYNECYGGFDQYQNVTQLPDGVKEVSYDVFLNGTILSLCVDLKWMRIDDYKVINIDVVSGEELSRNDVCDYLGTSFDSIYEDIRDSIEAYYQNMDMNTMDDEYWAQTYKRTVSDENIDEVELYLGEANTLNCVYKRYLGTEITYNKYITEVEKNT